MPSILSNSRDNMSPSPYRRSLVMRSHRYHFVDWATVLVALVFYFSLEYKDPFHRMFSLDDRSIQHPFTEHERIPNKLCLVCWLALLGAPSNQLVFGDGCSIGNYDFYVIYERAN